MSVSITIDVPRQNPAFHTPQTPLYKVEVDTESRYYDPALQRYTDEWKPAGTRAFLPGVKGWVTITNSTRISRCAEVPLTDEEFDQYKQMFDDAERASNQATSPV